MERVKPKDADLVVMNSHSMAHRIGWRGRQIVLPPIVNPDRYRTRPGERVTLINLNSNKGGDLFWKIAKAMPNHSFLAVKGAYHEQIVPKVLPSNVKLLKHTSNPKDIYAETRVLLMPSLSETWGRTAIEAFASGIPTIAHRSPGLEEALGEAGRFANRDSVDEWVEAIRELDSPNEYSKASDLSLARSRHLADPRYISGLEAELLSVIENYKK
jgi:glycosyltransferase involved in cell wall biosynthesis